MTGLQIRTVYDKENREDILNILLAVLFMTGISRTVCGAFASISHIWWAYGIVGSIMCILLLFLCRSRWKLYVMPVGFVVSLASLFLSVLLLKDGYLSLANDIFSFLTGKNGRIYLDYTIGDKSHAYVAALCVFFVLAVWLTEAILIRSKAMILVLITAVFAGQAAGFFLTDAGILLITGGTVLFYVPAKAGKSGTKILLRHAFSRIAILLLGLAVAGGAGYLFYYKEVSMNSTAQKLKEEVHKARYENGTESMPEGKLSNLGYWKKDLNAALEVEMDTPQKLYLRGMIGEVYTGLSWDGLGEEEKLKAEDDFYWLHKLGYYSQTSIADAMKLVKDVEEESMVIRNISACRKYSYLPYGLAEREILDTKVVGDATVISKSDDVNVSYIPGSLPQWYETELTLVDRQKEESISKYLNKEQTYSEFVYDNYLQMTNAAVGVCERIIGDTSEKMTLASITELIQERLELIMEYNERITTRNGENDFLQYTLEQQRKGYSVHYATAATLMLRYCGVPARYVEGYYIPAVEAAEYVSGQTMTLTENHAHAWAEYYLDGVGWIPFEVTPGYIDEEEILTAKKIAAGNEGTSGSGRAFAKNNLNYKPPIKSPTEKETEGEDATFRLSLMDMAKILVGILFILIVITIGRIIMRYMELKKVLEQMRTADNSTAIAMEYGYAMMLKEKADIEEPENKEEVQSLNQEALFSNHSMTDDERKIVEQYRKNILEACKDKWNTRQNLWNHYVLWLYR